MDNNQKEQMKKTVRDLASHTEKAASMAKDKISQQMEQENVKKAAEAAAKGARKASEGLTAFMEEGKKGTDKKRTIILAVTAVIGSCILGALGFTEILALPFVISLGILIYRAVKKKPKKNAAIATAVFFVLVAAAGIFEDEGVPDNVLDYLGTKENVVYQTYDKDDFVGDSYKVYKGDTSVLPTIAIERGEVTSIDLLATETSEKFHTTHHMNGLHIGDSISHMTECVQKMDGVERGRKGNHITYECQYKGKEVLLLIEISGNSIAGLEAIGFPGGK